MTLKELDAIAQNLDNKRQRRRELQIAKAQAELVAIDREYEAYFDGLYDAIKAVKAIMPTPTKKESVKMVCDNCDNYKKTPISEDCKVCVSAILASGETTSPSHWKPKSQPAEVDHE